MGLLDREFDIFALKRHLERANDLKDTITASADARFLMAARRTLFPLPLIDRETTPDLDVFPPFESRPIPALRGKKVALVAGGGAGACVSIVGSVRALEEAGVEPALILACSGGTIWGSMWAAGMDAQEMAEFSLTWKPEDYLDIRWLHSLRAATAALRGFSGLMAGEAFERLFNERFDSMPVGEFGIPLQSIVYDMDRGIVDYFGSETKPELPIGQQVRIAIALPLMIESVEVDGHLYVDGGIIDVFPLQPIIDDGSFDHVIGLNHMLPPQLQPPDITGWIDRTGGILQASRQLEQGYHVEFARRGREILGDSLTVIDNADHRLLRGVAFYEYFIDRSKWPDLIREGYRRTSEALAPLRLRRRRQAMAGASGSRSRAASMSDSENSGSAKSPAR